jgi:mono/diheme cytochrome c family protein
VIAGQRPACIAGRGTRLPPVRRLALIAAAAALAAGCGGEKTATPTAETVVGQPPAAPQPQAKGNAAAGKQVFIDSGCGGCHVFTPAGAEAKGTTGPDLDKLPDYAQKAGQPLVEFVRESIESPDSYIEEGFPSGVMPAWSGDEQDLADLVAFLTKP